MKHHARSFTVLLAALAVGCATTGSLEASRASYNQAEAERVRAEAEAAAAARRQIDAEQRRTEAGKALATGLVQAATDDVKAAEAARRRAEAKRAEACGLNPALPQCAPPAAALPQAEAPAPPPEAALPQAEAPAPPPAAALPQAEAPEAEAEAETDTESEETPDTEPPHHAHIKLIPNPKRLGGIMLKYLQSPPDKWEVKWKTTGVVAVVVGGKEAYTVRADRLGIGKCWRLGVSDQNAAVVAEEKCPAEGE